ncbi:hypothetical protein J3R83DRAFT_7969 [Lanmaoa asiatica]|nr:hypothetical protein J3R83DRAFT_7969 [Lanmaoa asiatica]
MATINVPLPPMGEISMILICCEAVLYGINCVRVWAMYVHSLAWEGKSILVLLVTSTILFLLCTIHVGASLRQLLEAFVYAPADVPNYSTTYWLDFTDTLSSVKNNTYNGLVRDTYILIYQSRAQGNNCCRCTVYASMGISANPNAGSITSVLPTLGISIWALGLILNVSVTVAVAMRLWWMGRAVGALTATQTNQYASSIYVVVESGAIFGATAIVMLALYASNNGLVATSGLDIASQLAALTPLLVVVWAGQTSKFHSSSDGSSRTMLTVPDEIPLRLEPLRAQDSASQDASLRSVSHSSSFVHRAHVI